MNKPRVSVVIPAYNQADYLAEAITSSLEQTYKDYEIIVVDDGSTDETPAVAQSFGSAIRYIRQENQGLAGARNTGIRHANGDYVALLDSDDRWSPDFLRTMMSLVEQNPEGVVYYAGWRFIDANGKDLPQAPSSRVVAPSAMYRAMLKSNFLIPSAIVMHRSTIVAEGMFDPAFRRLQDRELWVRLLRKGYKFIGSSDCPVYYRVHASSLSTDPQGGLHAVLALVEKHFGSDDGQWKLWTEEKQRAYSGAYRSCALTMLLRQHDWKASAHFLLKALEIDPSLADDVALFYEFSLGSQPPGYRGTPHKIDLFANAKEIESMLADLSPLLEDAGLLSLHRRVQGTAFYALGLVSFHLREFPLGRNAFGKALLSRPDLFCNLTFWRTWSKLVCGYRGYRHLSKVRKALKGI
ncbi:MAG: glycosyltransferase [Caldilineaceae bacterium]|nr:glycosyltransferase [Caldilineaceae bacterium]